MIKGFRDFLLRGNVVDLAVAVVIGSAFAKVVDLIVSNIINPLLAALVPNSKFGFGPTLRAGNDKTFMDFGGIISQLIVFFFTALVVYFLVVTPMNRIMALRKTGEEPEPAAPAEDVLLLQEIRDLLRGQSIEHRQDLPPAPPAPPSQY